MVKNAHCIKSGAGIAPAPFFGLLHMHAQLLFTPFAVTFANPFKIRFANGICSHLNHVLTPQIHRTSFASQQVFEAGANSNKISTKIFICAADPLTECLFNANIGYIKRDVDFFWDNHFSPHNCFPAVVWVLFSPHFHRRKSLGGDRL